MDKLFLMLWKNKRDLMFLHIPVYYVKPDNMTRHVALKFLRNDKENYYYIF